MGVDYTGIGGIGIRITGRVLETLVENGLFTMEEWDSDPDGCCETVKLPYATYGSAYSGQETRVLLVKGETFGEIKSNAPLFVDRLRSLGLSDITEDALEMIAEGHIW